MGNGGKIMDTTTWTSRLVGGTLALSLALALPPGLHAQASAERAAAAPVDARWLPFLGCWEAEGGPVEDALLCIRPGEAPAEVEFLTVVDGEISSVDPMRADGRTYENRFEGCDGSDRAAFSSDGRRVFTHSEYVCEGGVGRSSTGIIAMVSPGEWINVEGADVEGRGAAWVTRYRLAHPDTTAALGLDGPVASRRLAVRTARRAASTPLEVDDVIEATEWVDEEVVRSWVAEDRTIFELDAETLTRLADAGVPDPVIDVVVAVSHPDRFAVDRDARVSARAPDQASREYGYGYGYRPGYWGWRRSAFFGGSFFYDPFYASSFNPWGYGYLGGWGRGFFTPGITVVRPVGSDGGRVISGRGYTQGRSSRPSTRSGSRPGDRGSASVGSRGSRSGSMTSGGASKGSSSKSTGRKAKRRGGGGG
jgi:hypothetical protein